MLFFVILIILACVVLGLIILIQNPKGGGLAGNVGGFSNQLMNTRYVECTLLGCRPEKTKGKTY